MKAKKVVNKVAEDVSIENKLYQMNGILEGIWKDAPSSVKVNDLTLTFRDKSENHGSYTSEIEGSSESYTIYDVALNSQSKTIKIYGCNYSHGFDYYGWKFVTGKPVQKIVWEYASYDIGSDLKSRYWE